MCELKRRFPLLHAWITDGEQEDPEGRLASLEKQQSERLRAAERIVSGAARYLGGFLHDSWVIGVTATKDALTINLNEFSAHCFCEALAELKGLALSCDALVMPLTLRFADVTRIGVQRVGWDGELEHVRRKPNLRRLSEYLGDEVLEICEQHVALGMLFSIRTRSRKWPGHVLLDIEAGRMEILERQRDSFSRLFGEPYGRLWDAYWTERQARYFDVPGARDWLTNVRNVG